MIQRRKFLGVSAGAAGVLAFSPATGWAKSAGPNLNKLPELDGVVVSDDASLAEASQDVGYTPPRVPWAVLYPASVRDIQKMVLFCRRYRIKISARGQGHTTDGQGLNEGGLIIEMSALNQVHSISGQIAEVDAGVKWSDLLPETLAQGLRPPVLTGYLGLSVGGTLSVGGISSSFAEGPQIDAVEELEVVTGRGGLVTCSRSRRSELFHAVLGGLGQCGIIVKAKLRLVPAQEFTRVYTLNYAEPSEFFADLKILLEREELDDAFNFGLPDGNGGWIYQLTVAKYFNPSSPPNDNHLLRGLSGQGTDLAVQDMPFINFALRVDVAVGFFSSIGMFEGVMHPWFDVFLPDNTVEQYVSEVTAGLTPEDVGTTGFLLLFPQKRSKFNSGMLQVPECTEWVYLYDILTAAGSPGYDANFDARMRQRNRDLFDRAEQMGGKRYPIGTLEFSREDWRSHYGSNYGRFKLLKKLYDPQSILTPGAGIF